MSKDNGEPITNDKQYKIIVSITISRSEISFSMNKVCQFMQNPLSEHCKAVKRILRNLKGTISQGLIPESCKFINIHHGYADADWATDPDDRRSTIEYCIFLRKNPISWCSKKQPIISKSSIEAQYRSVASATAEIMWFESLLSELQIKTHSKTTIWCDNLSTVSVIASPVLHSRTKHMELYRYFIREQVMKGKFNINHILAAY